jgi:hypothetical protein
MRITDLIPRGSKNAISRRQLLIECKEHGIAKSDREMRRQIEQARKNVCVICLSDGKGYFIPDKSDVAELKHYINQEHDRGKAILRNLKTARATLEDLEVGRI